MILKTYEATLKTATCQIKVTKSKKVDFAFESGLFTHG